MVSESNSKQRRKSLKQKIAILYVLVAAGLWGSTGIYVRTLTGYGLTSMQITTGKVVIGLVGAALFLLIKDKALFRIRIRDIGWFAANGILIFFYGACYNASIQMSGMAVAAILLYTSPIFVILLSIVIFKEKLSLIKSVSLVLAFIGCALVSGIGISSTPIGFIALLLGLCSGFGYALYSIFSRILVKKYHSLTIVLYSSLFTALAAICLTDIQGIFAVCKEFHQAAGFYILAGIFTNLVPNVLYINALLDIEAGKASMLASVELVMAAVLGFLVFHETLTMTAVTGIVCIVTMVILLGKDKN